MAPFTQSPAQSVSVLVSVSNLTIGTSALHPTKPNNETAKKLKKTNADQDMRFLLTLRAGLAAQQQTRQKAHIVKFNIEEPGSHGKP
jgi:hypothetical protein